VSLNYWLNHELNNPDNNIIRLNMLLSALKSPYSSFNHSLVWNPITWSTVPARSSPYSSSLLPTIISADPTAPACLIRHNSQIMHRPFKRVLNSHNSQAMQRSFKYCEQTLQIEVLLANKHRTGDRQWLAKTSFDRCRRDAWQGIFLLRDKPTEGMGVWVCINS